MKSSTPNRTRIFISYSYRDQRYVRELQAHLQYYERGGSIDFWDDTKITPGSLWHREIEKAITSAKIALLLVSQDYLASKFIVEEELPLLLAVAQREGVKILSVIVRPCLFEDTALAQFQTVNSPSKPLSSMSKSSREAVWEKVVELAENALASTLIPPQVHPEEDIAPTTLPAKTTIYTYRGHTDRANAVRWSPDGKRITSASDDRTVQIWDSVTGRHTMTYQGHTRFIFAVTWSPDGKYIAAGGDANPISIIDAVTGRIRFTYQSAAQVVAALDWSPDGKYLASASANIWPYRNEEDIVEVVDVSTGTGNLLFSHRSHAKAAAALSWSPDGKALASASYDGRVELLDVANQSLLRTYQTGSEQVNALMWSPDGNYIVSGGDDGIVYVWDSTIERIVYSYRGHTGSVLAVAWSPDGQYIASAGEGQTVQVWNVNTGKTVLTYYGHTGTVRAIAWAPEGQRIASAGQDKTVQVWQISFPAMQKAKEQWLQEGNAYLQAERYEEALAAFEQAIHLDPNYARSYLGKGEALSNLRRFQEALEAFEQAIRLDPHYARSYHDRGNVLSQLNQYEEAAAAFEQALQLEQATGDVMAEQHELHTLGNLHANRGQLEKAERYYQEAQENSERKSSREQLSVENG